MVVNNYVASRVVAFSLLGLSLLIAISHSSSSVNKVYSDLTNNLPASKSHEEIEMNMVTAKNLIQSAGGFSIKLSNPYTRKSGIAIGTDYPWEYMAEPFKKTTFEFENSELLPDSSDILDYRWTLDGHLHGLGKSVDVNFPATGDYEMTVEAFFPGMESEMPVLYSKTITVTVKYVRREIRQLTDQDREAFFNAVSIIQRVPTKVGQKLYGDKYFSKDFFVRIHLYYGGNFDCDHWHQGPGFVTSHMTYTLMYEQALQSINPSLSMPYWDFTMESTFYGAYNWRDSPVFAPDWFGDASPDNELHTPIFGRFAYVPTMTNAKEFSDITNPFGLLRAPWNMDSTPFLTRSMNVYGIQNNIKPSGCSEYSRVLTVPDWTSLAQQLNSATHGHIHETVGGAWSHTYGSDVETLSDAVYTFAHAIQALSKILWRTGYVQCPESCDMGAPLTSCVCSCPIFDVEDSSQNNPFTHFNILKDSGVLDLAVYFDEDYNYVSSFVDENGEYTFVLEGLTAAQSGKIYTNMLKHLCNPGHIGDMFQATSSNDITFWVLHPTMDRMWHHKRLMVDAEGIEFDTTWDDETSTCYGHNPDNIQPFKNLFDSSNTYYTNRELYDLLDPSNENLPYIYADFEWDHCTLLGYKMS